MSEKGNYNLLVVEAIHLGFASDGNTSRYKFFISQFKNAWYQIMSCLMRMCSYLSQDMFAGKLAEDNDIKM
jgi:hypothetical protein